MVVQEAEMMMNNSQLGELEAQLQTEQLLRHEAAAAANKNDNDTGRQSSIYSLTLDEFQNTLCESGKNFGSMNMDEFLSSIWNAEENQQAITTTTNSNTMMTLNEEANKGGMMIRKQPSLPRPLCTKTVEEVWSEILKGQQNQQQEHHNQNNKSSIIYNNNNISSNNESASVQKKKKKNNTEAAPRQPTFGEMTLEDFLVKAGIVREPCAMPPAIPASSSSHHHQQQYGVYSATDATMAPSSFVARPVIGSGGVAGNVVAPPYPPVAQGSTRERDGGGGGGYVGVGGVCYGGSGYVVGPTPIMGMGGAVGPLSPALSDGVGPGEAQFKVEMGVLRGRKRMGDGPVEKVVERRQRRMIKNRESAARSRARKQAYTVELEAELNQLREENTQLKQALAELERRKRQQVAQCLEEMNVRVQTKAQKAIEKLRGLRRTLSCPL